MQSPLPQDGGANGGYTRILRSNLRTQGDAICVSVHEHGHGQFAGYPTISDNVAVNDHELLLDEREGKGFGDDPTAKIKRVYRVDIAVAQDGARRAAKTALRPTRSRRRCFSMSSAC
ncbi:esterase-like activity of phytase family protein [Caballeronia sp. INDeC2]|uniref:esterase-like activity of phytase family protein n=1 Tax=Caballeronia sp. INDeC2 TaxID=2921747 RepID=UPI0020287C04|nr:esterase-like activity of phytase family protein [Caballeronia sp. INDeC2]